MKTTMRKGADEDLFDRLVAVIEASGRDYKDISKAAGLGQNYVQQMIKNRKAPAVTNFMSIMRALGETKAIFVLTGKEVSEEDSKVLELLMQMSPEAKEATAVYFQKLLDAQRKP